MLSDVKNIEKLEEIYRKNPVSRIFAPLAESYRLGGNIKKALELCLKGIKNHPDLSSAYVVLAKIYLDKGEQMLARANLKKAVDLLPENIVAHRLLAKTHYNLKNFKEALGSYNMVLYLDCSDEEAMEMTEKLRRATKVANFEYLPTNLQNDFTHNYQITKDDKSLRNLKLVDNLIKRGDYNRANEFLKKIQLKIGSHPEILKRLNLLKSRSSVTNNLVEKKKKLLKQLLDRI